MRVRYQATLNVSNIYFTTFWSVFSTIRQSRLQAHGLTVIQINRSGSERHRKAALAYLTFLALNTVNSGCSRRHTHAHQGNTRRSCQNCRYQGKSQNTLHTDKWKFICLEFSKARFVGYLNQPNDGRPTFGLWGRSNRTRPRC